MNRQEEVQKKSRRDLLLILLFLPLGILCMFIVGGTATRLAPFWTLKTNMDSYLKPSGNFALQSTPIFMEPLSSDILTPPAWGDVYLTPNAFTPPEVPPPTETPPQNPPPNTVPPPTDAPPMEPTTTATLPGGGNPPPPPPPPPPYAKLTITKTDGSATYTPGNPVSYTITVSNIGSKIATGVIVTDTFDMTILSNITWSCSPNGGATCTANGTGNINDTVNLPAGSSITYIVSTDTDPGATANLSNTAAVTYNKITKSATDTSNVAPQANLSITKTDGSATYDPGNPVQYTIVVSNTGPSDASGATVTDAFNVTILSNITWSCISSGGATCTSGPINGNINDIVDLPAGSSITYTVNADTDPNATANLSNTAYVTYSGSTNSATDTSSAILQVDVSVTKTSSNLTYTAGGVVAYTVTVTNNGLNAVSGAIINDAKPAQVASWNWNCVSPTNGCDAYAGTGDFTDTVNLPNGGTITYTVQATTSSPLAAADLVNIVNVSLPATYKDSVPGDNSATVTIPPDIDLSITKTSGTTTYSGGGSVNYQVDVTNNSTFSITGTTVSDTKPPQIASWSWTCAATNATCAGSSGSILTDFTDTVTMQAGGSITYTVGSTIIGNSSSILVGNLVNTAKVTLPVTFTDSNPANNDSSVTHMPGSTSNINPGAPDNLWIEVAPDGASITIILSPAIVADGDVGTPDFAIYERYSNIAAQIVDYDLILVEISSNGTTWYPVFYWGDGIADTNTSLDITSIGGTEADNRIFQYPVDNILYNGRGVTIDVDDYLPVYGGYLPSGDYPYMRVTSPPGNGDGSDVDSIEIFP